MRWQSVVETPSKKNWLIRGIDMRKPPLVKRHARMVLTALRNSHEYQADEGGAGRFWGGVTVPTTGAASRSYLARAIAYCDRYLEEIE